MTVTVRYNTAKAVSVNDYTVNRESKGIVTHIETTSKEKADTKLSVNGQNEERIEVNIKQVLPVII